MTKDEIVRLWMKANRWDIDGYDTTINDLKRYSELVIAAEREACALVAEAAVPRHTECGNKIAAMIRKGGA